MIGDSVHLDVYCIINNPNPRQYVYMYKTTPTGFYIAVW